jgi:hypothetical protein
MGVLGSEGKGQDGKEWSKGDESSLDLIGSAYGGIRKGLE